jgi:hypothetical protein
MEANGLKMSGPQDELHVAVTEFMSTTRFWSTRFSELSLSFGRRDTLLERAYTGVHIWFRNISGLLVVSGSDVPYFYTA